MSATWEPGSATPCAKGTASNSRPSLPTPRHWPDGETIDTRVLSGVAGIRNAGPAAASRRPSHRSGHYDQTHTAVPHQIRGWLHGAEAEMAAAAGEEDACRRALDLAAQEVTRSAGRGQRDDGLRPSLQSCGVAGLTTGMAVFPGSARPADLRALPARAPALVPPAGHRCGPCPGALRLRGYDA